MKYLTDKLSEIVGQAFEEAGFDKDAGKVRFSDRPDLCEFQCNGAMALAKKEKKNPFDIAEAVAAALKGNAAFSKAEAVRPGFLNFDVGDAFLVECLKEMDKAEKCGADQDIKHEKIMVDYGGPNVAKPLHIGHLRAAIIGESLKRMGRFLGHEVIGDIHLGDWGLQMGLIIAELKERGKEYPESISELEEIYPFASEKSTKDEAFREKAMEETVAEEIGKITE